MTKKITIATIVVLTLAFTVYGYIQLQNTEKAVTETVVDLPVPPESIEILLSINNKSLLDENEFQHNEIFNEIDSIAEFSRFLSFLKEVVKTVEPASQTSHVQFINNGSGFDWVILQEIATEAQLHNRWKFVDSLQYAQQNILKFKLKGVFVYTSSIGGKFLFSPSQIALETCVRYQQEPISLDAYPKLENILKTKDAKADVNVIVNFEKLRPSLGRYFAEQSFFSEKLRWGVYDLYMKEKKLLLSGFSTKDETNETKYQPVGFEGQEMLPEHTIAYEQVSAQARLQQATKEQQSLWKELVDKEIVEASVFDPRATNRTEHVLIMKMKNAERASESLADLIENEGGQVKISPLSIGGNEFSAYRASTNYFSCFSKKIGSNVVFTAHNNYLVVGKALSVASVIRSKLNKRTFFKQKNRSGFLSNLPETSNYTFYLNPQMITYWAKRNLSQNFAGRILEKRTNWKNYSGLAFQTEQKAEADYTSACLEFRPQKERKAHAVWAAKLDTSVVGKPFTAVNHYTKNREVFVQDANNKVYLITEKGEILWSRSIGERINSSVEQVDFYRNGKLQMVFSTRSKIFMLDRVGRDVENYPLALPYPATSGVAVFDYDNKKDYRIFIACMDKKVYAFDKNGKSVEGWQLPKTETEVEGEIQHLRIGQKDYIVFADKTRNYILNRRGEERISIEEQFPRLPQNNVFIEMNPAENRPYFVTTDTDGNIFHISAEGRTRKLMIGSFSNNHFFLYKDFNGDGLKDYIFLDNKKLLIYNQLQKEIFSYVFDHEVFDAPLYFYFSGQNKKIGVFSRRESKVYLFDANGEQTKGFPLSAQSPLTISKLVPTGSQFNVLLGNENRFLFNFHLN